MKNTTKLGLKIGFWGLATVANIAASWFIGSKLGSNIGELIVEKSTK